MTTRPMVLAAALLVGCSSCDRREPFDSSRDDQGVVAHGESLGVWVEPTLHPRTRLIAPSKTALVWSSRVELSAPVASVEPLRADGAPVASVSDVGNDGETDGFEIEIVDEDLRRALRGVPVVVRVELESGQSVDASFDLGVALVDRSPAYPLLLPATLRAVGSEDLAFEATVGGPALEALAVDAAIVPIVSTDGGLWRFRWSVDDALTSALWRNGSVQLHAAGSSGVAIDARATVAPAVERVSVRRVGR